MSYQKSQNWRTEDKFKVLPSQCNKLLAFLYRYGLPDPYSDGAGYYSVISLYYDSRNRNCYRDHINGINRRFKCRLRSYNEQHKYQLEIKIKDGQLSRKVYGGTNFDLGSGHLKLPPLPSLIFAERQLLEANKLYPSAYTRYRRHAFTLDHFRITLDTQLAFAPPTLSTNFYRVSDCILEVKGIGSYPEKVLRVLSDYDLLKTSYSKYAQAIKELRLA